MSSASKEEYLESCRLRYPSRNREGKSRMIDEVSDAMGWDRKHTIKVLNGKVHLGKKLKNGVVKQHMTKNPFQSLFRFGS